MSMYNETLAPREKLEISLTQLLMITATVVAVLVIPAQLISFARYGNTRSPYSASIVAEQNPSGQSANATSNTGKVAGVQTEGSIINIPGTTIQVDLNSQTGLVVIAGLVLISIAIILLLYLLLSRH